MKPTNRREWRNPWPITLSISDDRPSAIKIATNYSSGSELDIDEAKALRRTLKLVIREARKAEARDEAEMDATTLKHIKRRAKQRKREGLE